MRFVRFPLPPSINKSLKPLKSTGRLVKTKEAQIWEKRVLAWSFKNYKDIDKCKVDLLNNKDPLEMHLTFVLHKPRFITKEGIIKKGRLDCGNFEKSTTDAISKLIGVDDAFFNKKILQRVYCENESDQQVIIDIKTSNLVSLTVFLEQFACI